jgi:hypothetical protein
LAGRREQRHDIDNAEERDMRRLVEGYPRRWNGFVKHPSRNESQIRNRILHQLQRIETGIDGLARTSLRFS